MSTRSNIAIFKAGEKDLTKFEEILYRHSDGYPAGVLPEITPILKKEADPEHWHPYHVAVSLVESSGGIRMTNQIHTDINFFYAVYPDRIDVYKVTYVGNPENWELRATVKLS